MTRKPAAAVAAGGLADAERGVDGGGGAEGGGDIDGRSPPSLSTRCVNRGVKRRQGSGMRRRWRVWECEQSKHISFPHTT
jgi:hypothetical protein